LKAVGLSPEDPGQIPQAGVAFLELGSGHSHSYSEPNRKAVNVSQDDK
jgi:hypothetical protein